MVSVEARGERGKIAVAAFDRVTRQEALTALGELARGGARTVAIDLARVERASTLAASTILELIERGRALGVEVQLEQASEELLDLLRILRLDRVLSDPKPVRVVESQLARLGGAVLDGLAYARELGFLAQVAIYWTIIGPLSGRGVKRESLVHEMQKSGSTAWPIVATIGGLMGIVLAVNAGYQLRQFGAYVYVADLVGVAITRELGPIITAILIAGRSGSTIAAEIGTMKVTEEIDALRTMGLNPGRFLVAPKVLALMLTLPGLVAIADAVAVVGGLGVATLLLGVSAEHYIDRTKYAVHASDILFGIVKSVVFAALIGVIACHEGFRVRGSAEDVGRAATASVVRGIFLVIAANAVFTAIFYGVKA